jgi:predicted small metal-binding protein
MPSIACRDGGLDCDWFFKADDIKEVLIEDTKHTLDAHSPQAEAGMKQLGIWGLFSMIWKTIKY